MTLDKMASFLADLAQKAEKATPGPWTHADGHTADGWGVGGVAVASAVQRIRGKTIVDEKGILAGVGPGWDGREIPPSDENARHMAAFDPEVCKALVRIAEASAAIDDNWCTGSHVESQCEGCPAHQAMWAFADLRRLAEERAA